MMQGHKALIHSDNASSLPLDIRTVFQEPADLFFRSAACPWSPKSSKVQRVRLIMCGSSSTGTRTHSLGPKRDRMLKY